MKFRYSARLSTYYFDVLGYKLQIEYRKRLKVFDLLFYPNIGRAYGAAQFVGKYQVRHFDFTALIAVIIKTSEQYTISDKSFFECLKLHGSELTMCDAIRQTWTSESPAHKT